MIMRITWQSKVSSLTSQLKSSVCSGKWAGFHFKWACNSIHRLLSTRSLVSGSSSATRASRGSRGDSSAQPGDNWGLGHTRRMESSYEVLGDREALARPLAAPMGMRVTLHRQAARDSWLLLRYLFAHLSLAWCHSQHQFPQQLWQGTVLLKVLNAAWSVRHCLVTQANNNSLLSQAPQHTNSATLHPFLKADLSLAAWKHPNTTSVPTVVTIYLWCSPWKRPASLSSPNPPDF